MRIGIMGGTFDPIHTGHLILAQAAYEQLKLDRVLFVPAGKPPHKRDRVEDATDEQRTDMVRLAIEEDLRFELDMMDMVKETPCYTYETVRELKQLHPENDYYFIIGGDSLVDYHTWARPEEIVKYCHIAAANRPGYKEDEFDRLIEQRKEEYNGDFIKITSPLIEISSSSVRGLIARGKAFRYMIPEKVYKYIEENNLYR